MSQPLATLPPDHSSLKKKNPLEDREQPDNEVEFVEQKGPETKSKDIINLDRSCSKSPPMNNSEMSQSRDGRWHKRSRSSSGGRSRSLSKKRCTRSRERDGERDKEREKEVEHRSCSKSPSMNNSEMSQSRDRRQRHKRSRSHSGGRSRSRSRKRRTRSRERDGERDKEREKEVEHRSCSKSPSMNNSEMSQSRDRRQRHKRSRSHSGGQSRSRSRKRRTRSRERDGEQDKEREGEEECDKNRKRRTRCLPPIKKEHLSVCSTTLWIGHVSKLVYQQDLYDTFGEYGAIVSTAIIPSRGCAFICMNRRQDADRALQKLKYYKLKGKPITLAWAPGKALKEKEWKDYWEAGHGVAYIPWSKLNRECDLEALKEGGMIDEETIPEWMKKNDSVQEVQDNSNNQHQVFEPTFENLCIDISSSSTTPTIANESPLFVLQTDQTFIKSNSETFDLFREAFPFTIQDDGVAECTQHGNNSEPSSSRDTGKCSQTDSSLQLEHLVMRIVDAHTNSVTKILNAQNDMFMRLMEADRVWQTRMESKLDSLLGKITQIFPNKESGEQDAELNYLLDKLDWSLPYRLLEMRNKNQETKLDSLLDKLNKLIPPLNP